MGLLRSSSSSLHEYKAGEPTRRQRTTAEAAKPLARTRTPTQNSKLEAAQYSPVFLTQRGGGNHEMSTDARKPSDSSHEPADSAGEDSAETELRTFSATINIGYIQRFLDAIRAIDDECQLQLSPTGISGSVVGPQNTTLAEVRLGAEAFDSYDTDGESGVIGVSTKRLREIVRMSNNSDLMRLSMNETDRTLRVRAGTLDCSLRLTDPATIRSTDGFDDEEYPSVVVLEGGELKRIMKAAGHVDDRVALRVEWTSERFVAEADNGDDRLCAPRETDDLVELFVGDEPAGATFDLSYLRGMKRVIRKRTEVTLALGIDLPLSVEFDIADGAGHVEYGIAPVVEAD